MKNLCIVLSILFTNSIFSQSENQINGVINNGQCGELTVDNSLDIHSININSIATDKFTIKKVEIDNDCIIFEVSYGGGCGITNFELITNNAITLSMVPTLQVFLKLTDDDTCKALMSKKIRFNLNQYEDYKVGNGLGIIIKNNESIVHYIN